MSLFHVFGCNTVGDRIGSSSMFLINFSRRIGFLVVVDVAVDILLDLTVSIQIYIFIESEESLELFLINLVDNYSITRTYLYELFQN